jgi:hypothetical protein
MEQLEKLYFQTLEDGVTELPEEIQGKIFRPCAINCIKDTVLPIMEQRYIECNGKLDSFFSSSYDSDYSFQKVIQKNHVYEFGYPKCFCPLYHSGLVHSAKHCECSRQSILFILEEIFPRKKFQVKTIETRMGGAEKCRFRIEVK